jgi:hypothetical protein
MIAPSPSSSPSPTPTLSNTMIFEKALFAQQQQQQQQQHAQCHHQQQSMNPRIARALLELEAAQSLLATIRSPQQPSSSPWFVNNINASCDANPFQRHELNKLQEAKAVHDLRMNVSPSTSSSSSLSSSVQQGQVQGLDKPSPMHNILVGPSGTRLPQYVQEVTELDVMCGRGGKSNHHAGNKRYRQVVSQMKASYKNIGSKSAKTDLSRTIVEHVFKYGGRFLKADKDSGKFILLTPAEARKKTSQALREAKHVKWTM